MLYESNCARRNEGEGEMIITPKDVDDVPKLSFTFSKDTLSENTGGMTELIRDAVSLYKDHPQAICDLIYWAVTLDDEERSALALAYRLLNEDESAKSDDSNKGKQE